MPSPSEPIQPASPRFAVISPTYNHGRAIPAMLAALGAIELPVIVVNDGSTDDTARTLEAWRAGEPSVRSVATHDTNRGKAAALLSGFRVARERGFSHALTIDSDGQHLPGDLSALVARSVQEPGAIILGARRRSIPGCPRLSRIGRAISNHFVWVASGVRVTDSQSGLRCYPLDLIDGLGVRAGRYGFETEILTRAGWAGVGVIEVPITCVYEVVGGRITHFRIVRDSWDAICMHARLIVRSMLPGDPVPRAVARVGAGAMPGEPMIGTILHRAWWWLGPRRLVAMVRGDVHARERLAASVAMGFFMATVPVYGVKTVACLWLSARFRLHPGVVIAVSSLSTPPIGFVFALLSLVAGHIVLHGAMPTAGALPTWSTFTVSRAGELLAEWIVGSVIVGAVLGLVGYAAVRLLLRVVPSRSPGPAC